eukprot:TRINITY_DN29218_c0_g5_i2.p1 TRINITY_DN29218_c0_g5~~TRINITY_DN29218_c0_g5_i2.p1  ORF type:complete len:595 (+),score=77.91 TRINITY_DN29218_c0_g5_i2:1133-2917(+)
MKTALLQKEQTQTRWSLSVPHVRTALVLFASLVGLYLVFSLAGPSRVANFDVAVDTLPASDTPRRAFDYNVAADKMLASEKFASREGKYHFFGVNDCFELLSKPSPFPLAATPNGTCYCQNPSTPYGWIMLPNVTEQETRHDDWAWPLTTEGDSVSASWRLEATEAVVLLGLTPPNCKYFSFSNYLFSRFMEPGWSPTARQHFGLCLPGGTKGRRCEIGASTSNSMNFHRMNLSDGVFDVPFALVISPSVLAMDTAAAELERVGVPAKSITRYPLPGDILKLGLSYESDAMANWLRMAFFEDEAAKQKYFREKPFRVFRMKMKAHVCENGVSSGKDDCLTNSLYPSFEHSFISRYSGTNDGTFANIDIDEVRHSLDQLERAVVAKYPKSTSFTYSMTNGVPSSGYECMKTGQRCQVDCTDAYYPANNGMLEQQVKERVAEAQGHPLPAHMTALLSSDPDDFMVVVGVNHAKAKMASYTSISIYDFRRAAGIKGIVDPELDNTALHYLDPEKVPFAPFLYAYTFARNCSRSAAPVGACYDVPYSGVSYLDAHAGALFIERSYDNPVTHVGPDGYGEGGHRKAMVDPKVIHFGPRT